jgi:hypothetical protein
MLCTIKTIVDLGTKNVIDQQVQTLKAELSFHFDKWINLRHCGARGPTVPVYSTYLCPPGPWNCVCLCVCESVCLSVVNASVSVYSIVLSVLMRLCLCVCLCVCLWSMRLWVSTGLSVLMRLCLCVCMCVCLWSTRLWVSIGLSVLMCLCPCLCLSINGRSCVCVYYKHQ